MSYHLGISPARVRRPYYPATPTWSSQSIPNADEDVTADSKDVLIERLNDLISCISQTHALNDDSITAIHSQVDTIEGFIRREERYQSPRSDESGRLGRADMNVQREEESFWGPPSPSQSLKLRPSPDMKLRIPTPRPKLQLCCHHENDLLASKGTIEKMAEEAETLAASLGDIFAELKERREESAQIRDLLVSHTEKSNERIQFLEDHLIEFDEDLNSFQSELKYLRIQLQAIEAQCSPYLVSHEDPVLTESIWNWMDDWEDIDRRSKARRKYHEHGSLANSLLSERSMMPASVSTPTRHLMGSLG